MFCLAFLSYSGSDKKPGNHERVLASSNKFISIWHADALAWVLLLLKEEPMVTEVAAFYRGDAFPTGKNKHRQSTERTVQEY